jgi:hypothetical protein
LDRRGGIGRLGVAAKRRLWNVDMHDVDQLFEQERVLVDQPQAGSEIARPLNRAGASATSASDQKPRSAIVSPAACEPSLLAETPRPSRRRSLAANCLGLHGSQRFGAVYLIPLDRSRR